MNRAAQATTGLLLALVCVADVALTIASRNSEVAGPVAIGYGAAASPSAPLPGRPTATSITAPPRVIAHKADEKQQFTPQFSSSSTTVAEVEPPPQPPKVRDRPAFELAMQKVPSDRALDIVQVQPLAPAAQPPKAPSSPLPSAPPSAAPAAQPSRAASAPAPRARLPLAPPAEPGNVVTMKLDASGGLDLPAQAHIEAVLRGADALAAKAGPRNLGEALDLSLAPQLKKSFDFIVFRSVSASFDAKAKEEHLVMDGVAALAWKEASDGRGRRYEADAHGLALGAGEAPAFKRFTETIVLPNRGRGFTLDGADVDPQATGAEFHRTAAIADGVFTMSASLGGPSPEPPVTPSPALDAANPSKSAELTLFVRAPANYQRTQQEVEAVLASTPQTLGEYLARGGLLVHRGQSKAAIADFEQATNLDSTSAAARAGLAVAEASSGDELAAEADLERAAALDPKEPLIFDGRAILAENRSKATEAVAAYGQALQLNPSDDLAREQRSVLEASLGSTDAALADTAELLRNGADPLSARFLRAQIYAARAQLDDALQEADAAVTESPNVAEAYELLGVVLAKQGKTEEARAQFARSATLHPTTETFAWLRVQPGHVSTQARALCWMGESANVPLDPTQKDCASGSAKSSQHTMNAPGAGQALNLSSK
jgi:tetratricopeptide (TPR) repeat protein